MRRFAAIALIVSPFLLSCTGDNALCSCVVADAYYTGIRLDSLQWIFQTKDSLLRGRLDSPRTHGYTAYVEGIPFLPSITRAAHYLKNVNGWTTIPASNRLDDTLLYFDVESLSYDTAQPDTAKIELAFRSTTSRTSTLSTTWKLNGEATCSLPLDTEIACLTAFTCTIVAAGDSGTAVGMKLQVSKPVDERAGCGG